MRRTKEQLEADKRMAEHRRTHFLARVINARRPTVKGECELHVTKNGFQWNVISFYPEELAQVTELMLARLLKKDPKKACEVLSRVCEANGVILP